MKMFYRKCVRGASLNKTKLFIKWIDGLLSAEWIRNAGMNEHDREILVYRVF